MSCQRQNAKRKAFAPGNSVISLRLGLCFKFRHLNVASQLKQNVAAIGMFLFHVWYSR